MVWRYGGQVASQKIWSGSMQRFMRNLSLRTDGRTDACAMTVALLTFTKSSRAKNHVPYNDRLLPVGGCKLNDKIQINKRRRKWNFFFRAEIPGFSWFEHRTMIIVDNRFTVTDVRRLVQRVFTATHYVSFSFQIRPVLLYAL